MVRLKFELGNFCSGFECKIYSTHKFVQLSMISGPEYQLEIRTPLVLRITVVRNDRRFIVNSQHITRFSSDSWKSRRRVARDAIVQRNFFPLRMKIVVAFVRKFIRAGSKKRLYGGIKIQDFSRVPCRNSGLRETMKREIMLKSEFPRIRGLNLEGGKGE